jgi:hypothetical protein
LRNKSQNLTPLNCSGELSLFEAGGYVKFFWFRNPAIPDN